MSQFCFCAACMEDAPCSAFFLLPPEAQSTVPHVSSHNPCPTQTADWVEEQTRTTIDPALLLLTDPSSFSSGPGLATDNLILPTTAEDVNPPSLFAADVYQSSPGLASGSEYDWISSSSSPWFTQAPHNHNHPQLPMSLPCQSLDTVSYSQHAQSSTATPLAGSPQSLMTANVSSKPYTCPMPACGKHFDRKCDFDKHQKYHSKLFKCIEDGCDLAFSMPKDLKRHSALHLDSSARQRFKCDLPGCGKGYARADGLARHKRDPKVHPKM